MNTIPRNILSGFLTTLFFIVSITGVMMFFKVRILSTEALHIWLGLGFVFIAVLHLVKNWNGFVSYFKKSSTSFAIGAGLLIMGLFIIVPLVNPAPSGVNPKAKMLGALMNSSLEKVAQFLDMDAEKMVLKLSEQGHMNASVRESVSEIAKAINKKSEDVLAIIFSK